jgi:hypothetical protein
MPNWRSRFRDIIWFAVLAVGSGVAATLSGAFGNQTLTIGFAGLGVILAILAEKP